MKFTPKNPDLHKIIIAIVSFCSHHCSKVVVLRQHLFGLKCMIIRYHIQLLVSDFFSLRWCLGQVYYNLEVASISLYRVQIMTFYNQGPLVIRGHLGHLGHLDRQVHQGHLGRQVHQGHLGHQVHQGLLVRQEHLDLQEHLLQHAL